MIALLLLKKHYSLVQNQFLVDETVIIINVKGDYYMKYLKDLFSTLVILSVFF